MKGEIDKDFYCSLGHKVNPCIYTCNRNVSRGCDDTCRGYHHKWPTLEQFQEKWDKKWDGAVYAICEHRESCHENCHEDWMLRECVEDAMGDICHADQKAIIVCACTPWGKPPADWRPE